MNRFYATLKALKEIAAGGTATAGTCREGRGR